MPQNNGNRHCPSHMHPAHYKKSATEQQRGEMYRPLTFRLGHGTIKINLALDMNR